MEPAADAIGGAPLPSEPAGGPVRRPRGRVSLLPPGHPYIGKKGRDRKIAMKAWTAEMKRERRRAMKGRGGGPPADDAPPGQTEQITGSPPVALPPLLLFSFSPSLPLLPPREPAGGLTQHNFDPTSGPSPLR